MIEGLFDPKNIIQTITKTGPVKPGPVFAVVFLIQDALVMHILQVGIVLDIDNIGVVLKNPVVQFP